MTKKLYEQVLNYVRDNKVSVDNCIHIHFDAIDVYSERLQGFTQHEKPIYLRLLMLNILLKEPSAEVLEWLINLKSNNKDILLVYVNILKRIVLKGPLSSDQEVKIINKCKNQWAHSFMRGTLSKILALLSHNDCFIETLNLDFILRYNICNKEMFLCHSKAFTSDFDLSNTLAGSFSFDKPENYNAPLISKFLAAINFTNYKYLKKTFLLLDVEMFLYLPIMYTELGLTNLAFILKDYVSGNSKKYVLKEYLSNIVKSECPLIARSCGTENMYTFSNVIRQAFLDSVIFIEDLFTFFKFNVFTEDEDLIDMIAFKLSKLLPIDGCNMKKQFKSLVMDCLTSIFPYRRILGIKVLEALKIELTNVNLKKDLYFDKSNIVRKVSQSYADSLALNRGEIEVLMNSNELSMIEPLIYYLKKHKTDVLELCKLARFQINQFVSGNFGWNIYNHLRILIEFDVDECKSMVEKVKAIVCDPLCNINRSNTILKAISHYYFIKKDSKALIDLLVSVDDLGVLLVIEKYLNELEVSFSATEIEKIIDQLPYNNRWILRSGGYSILFKVLSLDKKKMTCNILMNNLQTHIDCKSHSCNVFESTQLFMCQNIIYHSYSILLSIIDCLSIDRVGLNLCFEGLRSSNWIIKNNSLQLFKYIYKQNDIIEMNSYMRKAVKEQAIRELANFNATCKATSQFNDLLFCVMLIFNGYSCLDEEELSLSRKIRACNILLPKNDLENNLESKSGNFVYSLVRTNQKLNVKDAIGNIYDSLSTEMIEKIVFCLVSEDYDAQADTKNFYLKDLHFTNEKLVYEGIRVISARGELDRFTKSLSLLNPSFYDINYLSFLAGDFVKN